MSNLYIFGRIGKVEEKDLLIAWFVITLAFSIQSIIHNPELVPVIKTLCITLLTVGIGFMVHEMAHKFTAIKKGYSSEFKKDTRMLVIGLVLAAITGIVLAAPGAAWVRGNVSRSHLGKIAAAGPVSNLILCIPFGLMALYGIINPYEKSSLIVAIGSSGVMINAFLALFNMIPVNPFDGGKILPWDKRVYVSIVVVSIAILAIFYLMR